MSLCPSNVSVQNQSKELFGCTHQKIVNFKDKQFCQTCGIYKSNSNVRVFKTLKLKFSTFFNPLMMLKKALQFNKLNIQTKLTKDYINIRSDVIQYVQCTAQRLDLNMNCVFTAMYYLDALSTNLDLKEIYLFASSALFLASKSCEVDPKIPFISKLKRYVKMSKNPDMSLYETEDYKRAEIYLIGWLNWNLTPFTLLDRIETILSFGVIDEDDYVEDKYHLGENKIKLKDLPDEKIIGIVKKLESIYQTLCLQILRDELYYTSDHATLALSVVAALRKQVGLAEQWSQQLQNLTDLGSTHLINLNFKMDNNENLKVLQPCNRPGRLNVGFGKTNDLQQSQSLIKTKTLSSQQSLKTVDQNQSCAQGVSQLRQIL